MIKDSMDRLIHQMWDKEPIPEELLKWRETWSKYHPGWTFTFWNLEEMYLFIEKKYNWFYKTFTEYPTLIQKIDSFRYFLLYEYGGLYVDLDIECFKNIEPLIDKECVLFRTHPEYQMKKIIDADNREHPLRKHFPLQELAKGYFLTNSIFYSKRGNKFIKRCIDNLQESYEESKRYRFTEFDFLNKSKECNTHAMMSTSGGFLTKMFFKYGRVYNVKDSSYNFFEPYDHETRKKMHSFFGPYKHEERKKMIGTKDFNNKDLYGMHWNLGSWITLKDSEYKYEK